MAAHMPTTAEEDIEAFYDQVRGNLCMQQPPSYKTDHHATRVILAFVPYKEVVQTEQETCGGNVCAWLQAWLDRRIIKVTGRLEHVELWFPITSSTGLSCSTTRNNGVYLKERTFTDPKYCFYEIPVSHYEHDLMAREAYELMSPAGFDGTTACCLMMPTCCTSVRAMCRTPSAGKGWICSELVFHLLTEGGILSRKVPCKPRFRGAQPTMAQQIPSDDRLFTVHSTLVTTTMLFKTLFRYNVMVQCQNQRATFVSKMKTAKPPVTAYDFNV